MTVDRISIPYTPPALGYISIEETAKRVPSLGYQVYFADEKSTEEIERNVCHFISINSFFMTFWSQLETFVDTIFRLPPMDSFSTHGKLQSILDRGKDVHSPPQALLSDMVHLLNLGMLYVSDTRGDRNVLITWASSRKEACSARCHTTERPDCALRKKRARPFFISFISLNESDGCICPDDHLSPELSSTFPVLFFYGTEDPSCPPKNVDRMHKFIKRLRVVKLQDKGHWVMVESKEVISNEVINFISSLESKL